MAIYTVSQVMSYLNDVLEDDLVFQDIWVRGEVSSLARPGSGHSYFSLRQGNISMRAVMFRSSGGGDVLGEGVAVVVHGHLSVYDVRGDIQLVVDVVRAEGLGDLHLKLDNLRMKLGAEGLFEVSRKRPVPYYPNVVGVVTSPTGAVWQDVQRVIERRFPLAQLVLAPTSVQGDEAAGGIVSAIAALNEMPEVNVVLVVRGGGSLESLWPFNEEVVARAIFASRVTVVTGIGHETDYTIADQVADHRAPTPSVAAEMAVPDRTELISRLEVSQEVFSAGLVNRIGSNREVLSNAKNQINRSRPDIDTLRMRIDDQLRNIVEYVYRVLKQKSERSNSIKLRLSALSPRSTIRRGYAIVRLHGYPSSIVTDVATLQNGDQVEVTLAHGKFGADVTSTHSDEVDSKAWVDGLRDDG